VSNKPTAEGLKSWYKARGIESTILQDNKAMAGLTKALSATPLPERTRPYINAQDAGPIPVAPNSQFYYVAGIQNVGASTKSLFLSIFFGNQFGNDLSEVFAGRNASLPYVTSGPIAVSLLDPAYPLLPIEFTAPPITPAGVKTTVPRGNPNLASDYKPCMSIVGTAVLWRTDCKNFISFSDWPNDGSVEVCDRRNFHIGVVGS
jgi:hypothetical protein